MTKTSSFLEPARSSSAQSLNYGGTFSGYDAGDTLILTDLTYNPTESAVWTQNGSSGTLTINNGSHTEALKLAGTYSQDSFALTSDASGGTEVVWSPAQGSVSGLDYAGNAVNGYAVTADLTDPNASNITYTWLENGSVVGTSKSYTPQSRDVGNPLEVVIGFTDNNTAEQVTAVAGTVAAPRCR